MKYSLFIITGLFLFVSKNSFSQEAITPRPSPTAIVTMKYEDNYVKITYGQPHKRGREIFGGLVPYGQVWRTGANEATEITLTDDLLVKDNVLKAGTYTLFTIPSVDKWTIIFNKQLGQWGSYNYSESADALRIEVPTKKIENVVYEPFTIALEQKNEKADIFMMWDHTKVSIPIIFMAD
jgi:hypothetical protein